MLREYEKGKREFLIPLRRIYGGPFSGMIAGLVDQRLDRYLAMGLPAQEMDQRKNI